MNNYKIYGRDKVDVVIEMGLGASIKEWESFAYSLADSHGVLLYERYGVNHSTASNNPRTPANIALELKELIDSIDHEERLVVIGHSQGGLYAGGFCFKYPEIVKKLILVDPLSPEDNRFRRELDDRDYKKSGVDKISNFKIMKIMSQFGLKGIVKKLMRKAPPFCYFEFTKEQEEDILNSYVNITHLSTCMSEYAKAHDEAALSDIFHKGEISDIPLILITHSSEAAIKENMQFSTNTREFSKKIEAMWQEIMKVYLNYSSDSKWIQAKRSTHYIHLMEPEIIINEI